MSQSPLVDYEAYTTVNCNAPRNQKISKITVHHAAGVMSVEGMKNIIHNPNREVSCNYAIGWDARVGGYIKEENRSWCSSSYWNDQRAVTIEVSNSACSSDWPVSDKVWAKLVDLCVDICKRNGIPKLTYTGDQNGSLTFHFFYTSTACLPVDRTELLTPTGWKLLKDITYDDIVATVHIDNLGITFAPIEGIVPLKTQDTYTTRDFEATSDHRVMYFNQAGRQHICQYKDLYDKQYSIYLPNAGHLENASGFGDLSNNELELLIAIQADGHYMRDGNCLYGIEFHFMKLRKIDRVKIILDTLEIPYKVIVQSNHSVKIRIYGKKYVEWSERYLHNKCFTWEWLNMSPSQFDRFIEAILLYDGCVANYSYSSEHRVNIDIVQAIAALNGVGSKITKEHNRIFFKGEKRSLGENVRKRNPRQKVSCVTVRSGFILIRQHGRTTITGNCPGPYIRNRAQLLCDQVNAKLNGAQAPTVKPTDPKTDPTVPVSVKVGDLVSIDSNAVYWSGTSIPSWVKNLKWKISDIKNNRAILGQSEDGKYNIQSPIDVKYLTKINTTPAGTETSCNEQIKLPAGTPIYYNDCKSMAARVKITGTYTLVAKKVINGKLFGKLKSGAGWISLEKVIFNKGDLVSLASDSVYYNNSSIPSWVKKQKWYIDSISGDKAILGRNESGANNIQSPINTLYLIK